MSAVAVAGNLREVNVDELIADLQTLARNAVAMAFAIRYGRASNLVEGLDTAAISRLQGFVPTQPGRMIVKLNDKVLDRLHSFTSPAVENDFGHQQIAAARLPNVSLRARRRAVRLIEGVSDLINGRHAKPVVGADRLASALGQTAWTDPSFAFDVAVFGRNVLINHVIFSPGPDHPVSLSVQGLWVLIAFAAERSGDLPPPLKKRLVELGDEHAKTAGWAGFWDQFLIQLIADGRTLDQFDPNLFPLVPGKRLSVDVSPHQDIVDVLEADWVSRVPGYAEHLLNGNI
ncbi:MAG: hypothetical protein ABJF07_07705 [Nisaea sp.]|uniref:hypothetical protein n=1 Tax=Nisaea sp. TaxID=2024842 RepID=UPI0032637FB7